MKDLSCALAADMYGRMQMRVILDFSRGSKPTDNVLIENFNACVRIACFNQRRFLDLDDARTEIESWREDYNHVRPHSSIGERAPMTMLPPTGIALWEQQGQKLSIKLAQISRADH